MNSRSKLSISLALAGMVGMVGMGTMLTPAPDSPPAAISTGVPAGIPPDWFAQVCRQIEVEEYHASASAAGGLEAPNRAQNFRIRFGPQGIEIGPRNADGPDWRWQWQTTAWGRPGEMEPLAPTDPIGQGSRIEYARGDLVEWYENKREGIEQGFTIAAAPDGEGLLRLEGRVAAGLAAVPSAGGGAIDFMDEHGASLLRYGDLVVRDAAGEEIAAELRLAGSSLVIEVDDRGAAYPLVVDPLMTSPAWTAESNVANAQFGFSVATAGDVNGDGFSDAIVGAPAYSNGAGEGTGRAFVYLGSATGLGNLSAWSARPGFQAGGGEFGNFGESVGPAGDVNGDGYGDIIVGAPELSDDGAHPSEGYGFVWYGGPSGGGGGASGLGPNGTGPNADWQVDSDEPQANLGQSVATAGDVNGDGYDDIIIGATYYGAIDAGAAFVWLGSAGGLMLSAHWVTAWTQADAKLGFSVASAGDVNADGYADIIIGAPSSTNGQGAEGAAFLWLGSASGLGSNGTPLNIDWFAESNENSAQLGYSVATAGDVNGDGYADVILGAPNYGAGDEGAAFIWLGGPSDLGANGNPANADWTATSTLAGANFGTSVATAGDVNGDGFADVIAGAPDDGTALEGRAYAYAGAGRGPQTSPFWTREINVNGAHFGISVATAGDVNGDGFADVIAGAWLYSNGQANEGRALVYHGSADGPEDVAAWSAEGNQTDASLGFAVAGAGDVNGDGYSDILVGAPLFDNGQANEGRIFVYAGASVDPGLVPIWTAEANQADAQLGYAVAPAGDVNGDGYSDVLAGAPGYESEAGQSGEGAAFLWFGSALGLGTNGTPSNADWRAEGGQSNAELGHAVGSAGDVNGDGYADVVAGAWLHDSGQIDEGRAYVFHGSSSGPALAASWTEERDQAGERFGVAAAGAGDVNGDGYSDLIVGADGFDGSHVNEGRAWVFLGSANGLAAAAAWFADVDQADTGFGSAVATAGDVNGDGFSDVIIGAPFYDNGQIDEGMAFVYLGSAAGPAATAWMADGDQFDAQLGASVASAGDVNGDGYSDVVIGVPYYDGPEIQEGMVQVYFGRAAGLGPLPSWSMDSDHDGARFGCAVASAGDVTGDGFADLIAGAKGYDSGHADEGLAFIFYGNGTNGLDRIPRQARANDLAPIDLLGRSDTETSFRLKALGRTAAGRGKLRLEWEVKPLGTPFDGTGLGRGPLLDTGAPTTRGSAVALNQLVAGLTAATPYHWRLRTVTGSPFFPRSPWFSPAGNGRNETDLRTPAPGTGVADAPGAASPAALRLLGSRPNPVRAASAIAYVLPAAGRVHLAIYDVAGRAVASLVDEVQPAGTHEARWDGSSDRGERLAAGVYFARLAAGGEVRSEKLVVAR